MQNNFKWKSHVQDILTKASKRVYFVRSCRKENLPRNIGLTTCCTKIRPILEYATPIWAGLRHYLKEDIERVQNWDIGLYTEEYNWVARIKKELAKNIIAYRIQKITHVKIISGTNGHGYSLRTGCNPLLAPISHTDRHKQSFIPRAAWLSYFNEHSKQNSLILNRYRQ
jgi:hypothetical protein